MINIFPRHHNEMNESFWMSLFIYFSENPRSPSLLDKLDVTLFVKLDRKESLKLLCTLADVGTSKEGVASLEASFLLDDVLLVLLECLELVLFNEPYCWPCCEGNWCTGESDPETVGACTSTLNLAVAVTLVTWEFGVEHLDELPEFWNAIKGFYYAFVLIIKQETISMNVLIPKRVILTFV